MKRIRVAGFKAGKKNRLDYYIFKKIMLKICTQIVESEEKENAQR